MERQSTTFILMKILRDLNFNTNVETREQQRRFVKERLQRSNNSVENCIKSSDTDLAELIVNFSDIYTFIEQSKSRVENVRESLRECKNLLLLKRQDIRKLWISSCEQNALVRIYEHLDELKRVPSRLKFYLNKHLYIHASLLLLKAREHQELRSINALTDIDAQLKEERLALEDQLHIQLIDQLFDKTSRDILGNKTASKSDPTPVSRSRENRLLRKQLDQEYEEGKLSFESHSLSIIPDKYLLVDIRSQSPDLYLDVLIQSLSILFNLNQTLESVQKQLPERLFRIVHRTTQHILDNSFHLSVNNPEYLRELLESCYDQFKLVVKNIEHMLNLLKLLQAHQSPLQTQQKESLLRDKHPTDTSNPLRTIPFEIPFLFSIDIVWETLQQVLSDILYEYIDYHNTHERKDSTDPLTNSGNEYLNRLSTIDFCQYLTKRAPSRPQHLPRLFQFSKSAQFNTMTSYLQEQNWFVINTKKQHTVNYKQYVCKPNYRNITIIHDVLRRIIEDIDRHCELPPSKRILDKNLTDFIRDRFIGRVIKDIRESAQLSSSTITDQNQLIELIPIVLQKQLQLPVPILQSSYLIFKSCEELCLLVKCLPSYADDFCQAIADLLFKHRESTQKMFLLIVEKTESTSIYSHEWVKDPDINRHLRTMPTFDAFLRPEFNGNSNEHIRFRQAKETETLLINFSQNDMNSDDICTNTKHITILATIHESLDWLYWKLSQYFDILDKCLIDVRYLDYLIPRTTKSNSSQNEQLKLSRINLEFLSNSLKTIFTISSDLLLILFLEIRLHCFYYLSLLFRNTVSYAYLIETDPDEHILALNRDLTRLQETLNSALSEKKFAFLFQGLGFVLSTILIRSLARFNRISESGVTKMCRNILTIEQTLAPLGTAGDAELMRAHRFYKLLEESKPEEIINVIEEYDSEYTEQDYLNLLKLQYRSFRASDGGIFDLNHYEQLVKEALRPQSKNSK